MADSATPQPAATVLRLWDADGIRILSVTGPLTIATLFAFQEAWRNETSPALVFDLTQVPYADSAAIGSIVNAHVSRQNSGRKMAVSAGERVQKGMQITNVVTLFPVFSTLNEAIACLK
jgi:anti-sigma B factor antagonist